MEFKFFWKSLVPAAASGVKCKFDPIPFLHQVEGKFGNVVTMVESESEGDALADQMGETVAMAPFTFTVNTGGLDDSDEEEGANVPDESVVLWGA